MWSLQPWKFESCCPVITEDEIFITYSSYSPKVGIRHLLLTVLSVVWACSKLNRKPHSSSVSAYHEPGVRQTEKTVLHHSILLELLFLNVCLSCTLWNWLTFIEGCPLRKCSPCEDVGWNKLTSRDCVFLPWQIQNINRSHYPKWANVTSYPQHCERN